MRSSFFISFALACLALVSVTFAKQAVVRVSVVIPDGHKVTDLHLRFEKGRDKTEGSFEGEEEDVEEGPSLGKGPANALGAGMESPVSGRHVNMGNAVETFMMTPKKPGESHNTINKVIKLPR